MGAPLDGSRIPLTGVSGHLGSHLARALVGQGAEVKVHDVDLLDPAA